MDSAAARWNKLCWKTMHSPPDARVGAGPWACAHGIQDVAPTGAKQPWLFVESYLLHSNCDTCILLPISADSLVLSPGRGGILSAVGASPMALTLMEHLLICWISLVFFVSESVRIWSDGVGFRG